MKAILFSAAAIQYAVRTITSISILLYESSGNHDGANQVPRE